MKLSLKHTFITMSCVVIIILMIMLLMIFFTFEMNYENLGTIEYAYKAQLVCTALKILILIIPILWTAKFLGTFLGNRKKKNLISAIVLLIAIIIFYNGFGIYDGLVIENEKVREKDRLASLKKDFDERETFVLKDAKIELKKITKEYKGEVISEKNYISINDDQYVVPFERSYLLESLVKDTGNEIELYENSKFVASINNINIFPRDRFDKDFEYAYSLAVDVHNQLFLINYETGKFVNTGSLINGYCIRYRTIEGDEVNTYPTSTSNLLRGLKDGEYLVDIYSNMTGEPVTQPIKYTLKSRKIVEVEQ